jgi:hypothetical protein
MAKSRSIGKIIKRTALVLLILFILLLGALVAIPVFFRGAILEAVKQAANDNLHATVDFEDARISLLRQFPLLTLQLDDYSVIGKGEFLGLPLVKGQSATFSVDVRSVLASDRPVEIRQVHLDKPELNILILRDGRANYDITLPSDLPVEEPAADPIDLQVQLDQYSIREGTMTYRDRSTGTKMYVKGLNHQGKGSFTMSRYLLQTQTQMDALSVVYDGIPYLKKVKTTLDAGFDIDLDKMKFTLLDNRLMLNELPLEIEGFVAMPGNEVELDLRFRSPGADFKQLLSLIPNAYTEGYEQVKADGRFTLSGKVQGIYNDTEYPGFQLQTSIEKGSVKYPDLPLGITGIQANIAITSQQGDLDQMRIDIPTFRMQVGNNPISGHLRLLTPISDPDIDTRVEGRLDLAEFAKAFPIPDIRELSGLIIADITLRARMSQLDLGDYEQVNVSGNFNMQNIVYRSDDMPTVSIRSMQASLNPRQVEVPAFDMQLGKSDLRGQARFDNILAYFSPNKVLTGDLNLQSNYFLADEWVSEEESTPTPASSQAPEEDGFTRFAFALDANFKKIDYDVYTLLDTRVKGDFSPNRLQADQFQTVIGDSDFQASGLILNAWDYLFDDATLKGNIQLRSRNLNLNQFMTDDGSSPEPSDESTDYEPFAVPARVDLDIDADIDRVVYTNMDMRQLRGRVEIADEQVSLINCTTQTLGGQIGFSGLYDTQDLSKPAFGMKLDLQNLIFQQAFQTFNTFQVLAPIGQYIQGRLNSTLVLEGILGSDLLPDLKTLTVDGFLETFDALIKGYTPLQQLGNKLDTDAFESMPVLNTRNWFTIANGKVEVQEFDYQLRDIAMKIGGTHGLDQEMNYRILAKVPRELIGNNPVGAAAESGLDLLRKEASQLGVNIDRSPFVNLQVGLTGNLKSPKISIKLLGTEDGVSLGDAVKDRAREEIDEQRERIQTEVDDRVQQGKDAASDAARRVRDSLENLATQKAEEARRQAEARLKAEREAAEKRAAEELEKQLGKDAKEKVEDIKGKLENYNPLKKKRGN